MTDERREKVRAALASGDWTEGEKFVLKWQWGLNCSFYTSLVETVCRADDENRERLRLAFPSLVDAIVRWKHGDLAERMRAAGLMD